MLPFGSTGSLSGCGSNHPRCANHPILRRTTRRTRPENGDYLLLTLHGERNDGDGTTIYGQQPAATVAYEHFWTDHWSGGGSVRLATNSTFQYLVPELLLRHRSKLGPLTFGQRLTVYRILPLQDGEYLGSGNTAENWITLRTDLEKIISLGTHGFAIRPRLSYEAATHLRLQKATNDYAERTIQITNLRGEIGLHFNSHLDITPWAAYQTNYFITEAQFNSMNMQIAGGKLNIVNPVFGLDVRYTLFQGKTVFERRQLPTQH